LRFEDFGRPAIKSSLFKMRSKSQHLLNILIELDREQLEATRGEVRIQLLGLHRFSHTAGITLPSDLPPL